MAYPVSELSDHGSRRKFGIEFQRSCRLACAQFGSVLSQGKR